MFKLVVLSALVAVAVAKPHVVHEALVAAPVAYTVPAASSHTYREDVVSKPAVVATYAAHAVPVAYSAPIAYSSPVAYSAPVLAKTVAVAPAAVSHSYRSDVVSKPAIVSTYAHAAPVVSAYSAPLSYGYAAHVPVVHAW